MILLGERRPVPAQRTGAQSKAQNEAQSKAQSKAQSERQIESAGKPRPEHVGRRLMSYA